MPTTDPKVLAKFGLHYGHKHHRLHPKAAPYIWKNQSSISIIDLFKTAEMVDEAVEYLKKLKEEGKQLLVVATKKQAREVIEKHCQDRDINHITTKWVGGFLTNFQEVSKNIKKMLQMKEDSSTGAWDSLVKHEKVQRMKKLNRIAGIYKGVENIKRLPDALLIVDIKRENNALVEATQMKIPTIAIVDTNCDPSQVTIPIVANDDAISGIDYLVGTLLDAYRPVSKKASEKTNEDENK